MKLLEATVNSKGAGRGLGDLASNLNSAIKEYI